MKREELLDHRNWVGKSPIDIRSAVERFGGWPSVLMSGVTSKSYIHRVRNYFNVYPQKLREITTRERTSALSKVTFYKGNRVGKTVWRALDQNSSVHIKAATALTGLVMKDERGRLWYHMDPIGASYHINKGEGSLRDIFKQATSSEIMKFISPDGQTKGSHEVIIDMKALKSFLDSQSEAASSVPLNAPVIVSNPKTQATYNYGETVTAGTGAHNRLDVVPHKGDKSYMIVPGKGAQPINERKLPTDTL